MRRWLAITAAVLFVTLAMAILSGGLIVAATWPGTGPDNDYRATFAVQTTFPPRCGFIAGIDNFTTFGRPGVLWIWNNQPAADWGGP